MSRLPGRIRNPEVRDVIQEKAATTLSFSPLAADNDWFKTSTAPTAGADKTTSVTSFTKAYCPGHPVVPVTVVTDGADDDWTAVSVVLYGTDQFGHEVSETVAGTNSSGTWTATATTAFELLRRVDITVTGTATGADAYIIGFAKTYGIGQRITATAEVIAQLFNGAADAGTVSVANNTIVIAGTPDGAKIWTVYARGKMYAK